MYKIICDACKKEIEKNENGVFKDAPWKLKSYSSSYEEYEICKECKEKLVNNK